mmetsp:Transcript_14935/g.30529  ORF Transcript_14935/g.30529 Transcript_14935/m.30529 type:complete len:82 (-) Transcript_14935:47-292(-)
MIQPSTGQFLEKMTVTMLWICPAGAFGNSVLVPSLHHHCFIYFAMMLEKGQIGFCWGNSCTFVPDVNMFLFPPNLEATMHR